MTDPKSVPCPKCGAKAHRRCETDSHLGYRAGVRPHKEQIKAASETSVTVSREGLEQLREAIENPKSPTDALKRLMRSDT